jgi:hypothetical protein
MVLRYRISQVAMRYMPIQKRYMPIQNKQQDNMPKQPAAGASCCDSMPGGALNESLMQRVILREHRVR